VKRVPVAAVLLALVALLALPVAAAQADPVEEFSFQLKDLKPDGRYTLVFSSRSYDTSGGQPPAVTGNFLRLPVGVELRREFLKKAYRCDPQKLKEALEATPESGNPYSKRLDNLKATLRRVRGKLDAKAIANWEVCLKSQVGRGRVQVDIRPLLADLIPVKIFLFLSPATEKGAIASFGIISAPDEGVPLVRDNPVIAGTRPIFHTNLFKDPTPDGLYSYRLVLPVGPVAGIKISIAELTVTNTGLTAVKKTVRCLQRKRGKCVRRKVTKKNVFWVTQPTCPASGQLSFLASYTYETGLASTRTLQLPCPRFLP